MRFIDLKDLIEELGEEIKKEEKKLTEKRNALKEIYFDNEIVDEDKLGKIHKFIDENTGCWTKIKGIFKENNFNICWYCESDESNSHSHLEHFRPKKKVDNLASHNGYWWLAFDLNNYRISCPLCNSKKGNKFPIFEGSHINKLISDNFDEKYILLDPCNKDDSELLVFSFGEGKFVCSTEDEKEIERVSVSVETYDLSRKNLIKDIKLSLRKLRNNINLYKKEKENFDIVDNIKAELENLKFYSAKEDLLLQELDLKKDRKIFKYAEECGYFKDRNSLPKAEKCESCIIIGECEGIFTTGDIYYCSKANISSN